MITLSKVRGIRAPTKTSWVREVCVPVDVFWDIHILVTTLIRTIVDLHLLYESVKIDTVNEP